MLHRASNTNLRNYTDHRRKSTYFNLIIQEAINFTIVFVAEGFAVKVSNLANFNLKINFYDDVFFYGVFLSPKG